MREGRAGVGGVVGSFGPLGLRVVCVCVVVGVGAVLSVGPTFARPYPPVEEEEDGRKAVRMQRKSLSNCSPPSAVYRLLFLN
jgi:hypothetical protein